MDGKDGAERLMAYLHDEVQGQDLKGYGWSAASFVKAMHHSRHQQALSNLFAEAFFPAPDWDWQWTQVSVLSLIRYLRNISTRHSTRYRFSDAHRSGFRKWYKIFDASQT